MQGTQTVMTACSKQCKKGNHRSEVLSVTLLKNQFFWNVNGTSLGKQCLLSSGSTVGQDLGLLGLEDRGHYNPLKCHKLLS
jgi:hypothetical protein